MTDRNRAKGMLWGLIVGDAFGSPIQFSDKDSHPWITEMVECPPFGLPPGYWTDDGSMAMCIMDSYVRKGGYDLKDIARTFVRWLDDGYLSSMDGRSFDVGCATEESVAAFMYTGSLVNGSEDSQGNGSIMRFAPSYLLAQNESDPVKVMHEISDLTHSSERVREVVDRFAKVLGEHMAGKRTVEVSPYKTREEVDNSGWAVSTLDAALWAFNTTETFEAALVAAVNLGGDSDTIGAVCGQIAGAYYGFDAIPDRWVKAVKTWEKVDELIERFLDVVSSEKTNQGMAPAIRFDVTPPMTEMELSNRFWDPVRCHPDFLELLAVVARRFELTVEKMVVPKWPEQRTVQGVWSLRLAMYIARRYMPYTLQELGELFLRNHTTILLACIYVKKFLAESEAYRIILDECLRELKIASREEIRPPKRNKSGGISWRDL